MNIKNEVASETLKTVSHLKGLITRKEDAMALSNHLATQKVIAIDTEFIRETTFYPKIALIQVATDKQSWLLDPVQLDRDALSGIIQVFKDPNILKVMHAAYADQECFYTTYHFVVEPVMDTAVAGALCGLGDNLGLGRLLKDLLNVHLPKGRARARWLQRPLSPELLAYAEQDVAHLVELGEVLMTKLRSKGRLDWALDESAVDSKIFEVTADEMAQKMAKSGQLDGVTYTALIELLRWREDRAKKANLPRGWVADNETVLGLARSRPRSIEELRSFRGLGPKEVDRSGTVILEAIQTAVSGKREKLPPAHKSVPRSEREDHVLDFIHTYVALLGATHEIAVRYLLNSSRSHLLLLATDHPETDWLKDEIMSRNAWDLIGQDLLELMRGKKGLALKNGRVEVLPL